MVMHFQVLPARQGRSFERSSKLPCWSFRPESATAPQSCLQAARQVYLGVQKPGALIQTPNSRALTIRTPTERTRKFIDTAIRNSTSERGCLQDAVHAEAGLARVAARDAAVGPAGLRLH